MSEEKDLLAELGLPKAEYEPQEMQTPVYFPIKPKSKWPKRFFFGVLCAMCLIAIVRYGPTAVNVCKALTEMDHSEHFTVEVEGHEKALTGFINGEPCVAVERSNQPIILRAGRYPLDLYKSVDYGESWDPICMDIKQYAVLQGGLYKVVSRPHEANVEPQVCKIRLDRITKTEGISYADSSTN